MQILHFLKLGQCALLELTQQINGKQVCFKKMVTLTSH